MKRGGIGSDGHEEGGGTEEGGAEFPVCPAGFGGGESAVEDGETADALLTLCLARKRGEEVIVYVPARRVVFCCRRCGAYGEPIVVDACSVEEGFQEG